MTDPFDALGHGPADPPGYIITREVEGYVWTVIDGEHTEGPFGTRDEAVAAAEADRQQHLPGR